MNGFKMAQLLDQPCNFYARAQVAGGSIGCSLAGLADMARDDCPAAAGSARVPASCPVGCAAGYTAWWGRCQAAAGVLSLDADWTAALSGFYELCGEAIDCSKAVQVGSGH
jgi:hypothetical protein